MDTVHSGAPERALSNGALIREITAKISLLARKELELAKAEIRADMKAELMMVKALAISAVAALVGLNLLFVAPVLALALLIPGWLAALAVGGAILIVAAIVGYLGWRRHVARPLPLTRQTLKEDLQWMKERLA